jgi:hypothetical protein
MAKKLQRHWLTGKFQEVETSTDNGRVVYRTGPVQPTRARQKAIRDDKPHVSRALGVPPQQSARFNKRLREFGITDAAYSKKTGFLESRNEEHRAAAMAVRGYYDREAQSGPAMRYANAIGF